jgi:hypothetical protein
VFPVLDHDGSDEDTAKPYPLVVDLVGLVQRVGTPRAPRVVAHGGTFHAVAQCNTRAFFFTTAEDFDCLLAPTADPRAKARDPRWTAQRAKGSPGFMAPYVPGGAAHEWKPCACRIKRISPNWRPVPFYGGKGWS